MLNHFVKQQIHFCIIKLQLNVRMLKNRKSKRFLSSIFDYLKSAKIEFDSIFNFDYRRIPNLYLSNGRFHESACFTKYLYTITIHVTYLQSQARGQSHCHTVSI